MQYPRISKAKAVDDNTLIIEFSNEESKEYKIHHLLEKPMFAPLRQPAFFKNFKIEPGGYALTWTEEIDISEYELLKNGTAITQEAASISEIFQERRDLSQASITEALEEMALIKAIDEGKDSQPVSRDTIFTVLEQPE